MLEPRNASRKSCYCKDIDRRLLGANIVRVGACPTPTLRVNSKDPPFARLRYRSCERFTSFPRPNNHLCSGSCGVAYQLPVQLVTQCVMPLSLPIQLEARVPVDSRVVVCSDDSNRPLPQFVFAGPLVIYFVEMYSLQQASCSLWRRLRYVTLQVYP
jgi:hypothetical protein